MGDQPSNIVSITETNTKEVLSLVPTTVQTKVRFIWRLLEISFQTFQETHPFTVLAKLSSNCPIEDLARGHCLKIATTFQSFSFCQSSLSTLYPSSRKIQSMWKRMRKMRCRQLSNWSQTMQPGSGENRQDSMQSGYRVHSLWAPCWITVTFDDSECLLPSFCFWLCLCKIGIVKSSRQ